MRVLVTGSRDWQDYITVWVELDILLAESILKGATRFTVVHGDCPRGVDRYARAWVARRREMRAQQPADHLVEVVEERHPADWGSGKAGGFIRNKKMVDLGADVCVAFQRPCAKGLVCHRPHPHASHGTEHCATRALEAGIAVREVREGW